MTSNEALLDQNQACLESFVLRARRVEAHSLVADLRQVLGWASNSGTMERTPDGRIFMVQQLPPEELLESLAARVRPLILDDDPIHYGKVFGAIGFLLGEEDRATEKPKIKELRRGWNPVRPDYVDIGAYSAQVTDVSTGETSEPLTSNRLAYAWIYGDTVHADAARRAQAKQFGIKERFRAAAGLVAQIVFHTIALLNYVRELQSEGKLTLPEAVLEHEVIVRETVFRDEAQFYVADNDTEPQFPLTRAPGPEWRRVTDPSEFSTNGEVAPDADAMVTVEIRPSSLEDQQVRQLIESPDRGAPAARPEDFTPPQGAFFAAWVEDQAIGCIGVRRHTETEGEIKLLTVTPQAQGTPLGRHLLRAAEGAAQHLAYTTVLVDVSGTDNAAMTYLRTIGYEEAGPTSDAPAKWFRKSLTEV